MIKEFFATDLWKYLLGAILGTCLPTPADPLHFYIQNWLYKHKLKRWQFELIQILDWYFLDALWYMILAILAMIFMLNESSQIKGVTTILTIIGVGAIVSMVWRFVSKRKHKK